LNFQGSGVPFLHPLFVDPPFEHEPLDNLGCSVLLDVEIVFKQVLLAHFIQLVLEVIHNMLAQQPATHDFLNDNYFGLAFIKEYFLVPARPVTSVQTLDQNTRRVAFENALKPVDVHIQADQVALSTLELRVVGDVELHELVETTEAVPKTGVFDSLLVRNDMVIECFKAGNGVDHEVSVPRNVADRVREESDVQDRWHACQTL